MEMKINSNTFWILQTEKEKWAFDSDKSAIAKMKDFIRNGKDAELLRFYFEGDKIKLEQVPWKDVATALIRE
ncbi:MAG: hypothetical protein ACTSPB_21615 [Candidatus Thorarchaeota archaeon]